MTIFLAVAVFAAIALLIFMAVGDRSTAEVRLAQLQTERSGSAESDVWESFRVQDLFSVITRPLAPFRDWLRSRDSELAYRLSLAGLRRPEDPDTFLTCAGCGPPSGYSRCRKPIRENHVTDTRGAAGSRRDCFCRSDCYTRVLASTETWDWQRCKIKTSS